jgi:hypothetical protein
MITLTPAEERLRQFLVDQARKADPAAPEAAVVTYTSLVEAVDADDELGWRHSYPRFAPLSTPLYHVALYEAERQRPLVTALAVRSGLPLRPGDGFYHAAREAKYPVAEDQPARREFWRDHLAEVVAYWSRGPDLVAMADARHEAVMTELATIKRMLRQLMHGQPAPS